MVRKIVCTGLQYFYTNIEILSNPTKNRKLVYILGNRGVTRFSNTSVTTLLYYSFYELNFLLFFTNIKNKNVIQVNLFTFFHCS